MPVPHTVGSVTAPYRLMDVAGDIVATDLPDRKLRLFFEFMRGAQDDGHDIADLISDEPASTGDVRYDALLAAAAEHLAHHHDLPAPDWAFAPDRFLDGFWWVSDLQAGRALALVHSAAAFRARGVMMDAVNLSSA